MICVIYLITALHPLGPGFWATPLVDLIPGHFVHDLAVSADKALGWSGKSWGGIQGLGVGVSFMMIGALGTVGNIVNSYVNVLAARRKSGKQLLTPLLGYLPFMTHTLILVLWLQAGVRGGQEMIQSSRLLPFIGYWGMSFSYQVSQLILAHVTKSPFPYWNGMMVYSTFGMLDANAQYLFGRQPLVQNSSGAADVFIYMSFFVALFNYIRFAREVIWQICEHTGIACFTVRHKDSKGNWVENDEVHEKKSQ